MQNASSQTATASPITAGGLAPRTPDTELFKTALVLAGRALVRIRLLHETALHPQGEEARKLALELIGSLADSAHNLPLLVAEFGTNAWATADQLRTEIGLCERALREASARVG